MHELLSAYNEYPDITKEFTGPKNFVITRLHSNLFINQPIICTMNLMIYLQIKVLFMLPGQLLFL